MALFSGGGRRCAPRPPATGLDASGIDDARASQARQRRVPRSRCGMIKLQQDQLWKKGDRFLRITALERLAVEYKEMADLETKEGERHVLTKKEFCRLLKGATLIGPNEPEA
jgi:hypothetical protein